MNCPQCSAEALESDQQCPGCGILFSKWQERAENVLANPSRYAKFSTATSSEFNWTVLAIICAALSVTLWFIGRAGV